MSSIEFPSFSGPSPGPDSTFFYNNCEDSHDEFFRPLGWKLPELCFHLDDVQEKETPINWALWAQYSSKLIQAFIGKCFFSCASLRWRGQGKKSIVWWLRCRRAMPTKKFLTELSGLEQLALLPEKSREVYLLEHSPSNSFRVFLGQVMDPILWWLHSYCEHSEDEFFWPLGWKFPN